MVELFAAMQGIDPFAAVLWSLFIFAAGMYPVGIMLGSQCNPCCPCPCASGTLPDTLTVTFKGLPDQTKGNDLIGVSFSSCFGSGASARILEPGGVAGVDDGPIEAVSLVASGSGYAKLGRVAPTLTATGSGTGATLTVVLGTAKDACDVDYWLVDSVTVSSGGTGYTDGDPLTLTESVGDSVDAYASATINTVREEPPVSVSVFSYGGGFGALITATLTQGTDYYGKTVWSVDSLTIDEPGTGYELYDSVSVTPDDGTTSSFFYGFVSGVDGGGGITAIDIFGAGEFYKATDVVESVTVANGGVYYREDPEEQPYVAPVIVTLSQDYPSDGTGAAITATVDDDTDSETFGQITKLELVDAGDDYLAWEWKNTKCCGWYWDDKPIVVRRSTLAYEYPCELTFASCFGSGASGKVTAPGETIWSPAGPIESVSLTSGGSGYAQIARSEDEPTVTPTISPGSGAAFTVTLEKSQDACGLLQWSIASVAVDSPGSGYQNNKTVSFLGDFKVAGTGIITTTKTGGIESVSLTNKGVYYKHDTDAPPHVASVSIGFESTCAGVGASIVPTIDTDTKSQTFGQITKLTVASAGDGYSAGFGRSAGEPSETDAQAQCFYSHRMCGGWNNAGFPGSVVVQHLGSLQPPRIFINTEKYIFRSSDVPNATVCDSTFIANAPLADCGQWDKLTFTNTLANGDPAPGTATVVQGGTYDPTYKRKATVSGPAQADIVKGFCDECCQGEADPPQEITVTLEDNRAAETDLSGDYVLTRGYSLGWNYSDGSVGVNIQIVPGRCNNANVAACDNCIKYCEALATISAAGLSISDSRNLAGQNPEDSPEQQAVEVCNAFCTVASPTCSPSGMTFNFFDPTAETQATTVTLTVQ